MGQSDLALGRRTVLVVDDHPGIREALGLILEDTYDLLFADDGPPALQLLTEKRVDAILLDLGLRDMDGFEVLAKIRSIAPRVPVIILTVRDTAADAVRALKLGARDYMTKPFDENTVHMRLSESLAAPADVQATHDDHGGGELRTRPVLAGSGAYIRPRCVVVAGHVGTAGALRVMLDRYIPTNSSTDCFHAAKILGIAPPECVVLDERAWELDGPSFVRILRLRSPAAHILLLSDDVRVTAQPSARVQFGVTRHHRLGDVIRHVLEGLMVTGVAVAGMALSDHVLAAVDFMRTH